MVYEIYTTEKFDREIEKLSNEENKHIENIYRQIEINPYVGDQLQIKVFREKRLKKKRVYYLIFDDLNAILMVGISDKKTQQKEIDFISRNINSFRETVIKAKNN
mgnify:CR=1 FL=1